MVIFVNGERREIAPPVTISELLKQLELPARGTAVEVNQQIVARPKHDEHLLADGDTLEIVTLVGGG